MGTNHMGRQSILFPQPPVVRGFASVAGKKEREGPLGDQFTATVQDTTFGEKSWERAERRMQQMTLELALEKAGLTDADLDAAFAGDLLNQCIGSSFSLRNRGVPTLGLYGACSTMAESLLLAAMSVSGGFARTALAMTSSHFASSERQYRFPLGYGGSARRRRSGRSPARAQSCSAAGNAASALRPPRSAASSTAASVMRTTWGRLWPRQPLRHCTHILMTCTVRRRTMTQSSQVTLGGSAAKFCTDFSRRTASTQTCRTAA